ncbi:MAG: PAS domain S-box protein [Chitinophagaceae bacterium]|nr:MAG: PAS domain S-box protein [Chitinophagaceae bacterium]
MATEEPLLLHLFENTLDWVCIVDKQGWFKQVNPAVLKTLGYSWEELSSERVSARLHPEDNDVTAAVRVRLINNEPLINFQNRYVAKDGRIIWLQWTSVYMPEKELVFAIAKDITAQKELEIESENNLRKFKDLTAHFKNLAERDRQFFASELHEELGQLAAVLKMDLEWIGSLPLQLDDASQMRVRHGAATAQVLLNKIRKLSYSIDSSQIDVLGLDATLRSLSQEFSRMTGITCTYQGAFKEDNLSRVVKLDLLRISQDALAHVLRQEQATEVVFRVTHKKDTVELLVRNNGKVLSPNHQQGVELENMFRRVASINGEFVVKTKKDQGTSVSVRVKA